MIVLLTGASHTGKTVLAQKLLEKYKMPYLSMDHLKMGLIRSGNTNLTPMSRQEELTEYLWPIACEMIKTAIENKQNLIVEGCYIPFDWEKDFTQKYLKEIQFICLIMSETYIKNHFEDVKRFANVIENRLDDTEYGMDNALRENAEMLEQCRRYKHDFILIEDAYRVDVDLSMEGENI